VLTAHDGRWRLPLEWTLDPLPMASGATSITLRMPQNAVHGVQGRVDLRANRAAADSLVARAPASVVTSMSDPGALQAGGDIDLSTDALTLASTGSSGGVSAVWRNARLVGVGLPLVDLGTLTAKLTVRGNALAGPVTNQAGAVKVSGEVLIGADRIAADLRLMPEASASPALRKALESLGSADASGAVSLRVDRSAR
jgi:hypothetical protein